MKVFNQMYQEYVQEQEELIESVKSGRSKYFAQNDSYRMHHRMAGSIDYMYRSHLIDDKQYESLCKQSLDLHFSIVEQIREVAV